MPFIYDLLQNRFQNMTILYIATPKRSVIMWPSEKVLYQKKHDAMRKLLESFSSIVKTRDAKSPRPLSRLSSQFSGGRQSSLTMSTIGYKDSPASLRAGANSISSLTAEVFTVPYRQDTPNSENADLTATPSETYLANDTADNEICRAYAAIQSCINEVNTALAEHKVGQCDGILRAMLSGLKCVIQINRKVDNLHMDLDCVDENSNACAQWIKFLSKYIVLFSVERSLRNFSLDLENGHEIDAKYYASADALCLNQNSLNETWNSLCNLLNLLIDIYPKLLTLHDKSRGERAPIILTTSVYLNALTNVFRNITTLADSYKLEIDRLHDNCIVSGYIVECDRLREKINALNLNTTPTAGNIGSEVLATEDEIFLPSLPRKMPSNVTANESSSEEEILTSVPRHIVSTATCESGNDDNAQVDPEYSNNGIPAITYTPKPLLFYPVPDRITVVAAAVTTTVATTVTVVEPTSTSLVME